MVLEKIQRNVDKGGFAKRDVLESLSENERKELAQELSKYPITLDGYGVIVQYKKIEITLIFKTKVVDLANAMQGLLSVKFDYKDRLFRAFHLFKRFESTLEKDGNIYTGNIFKKMNSKDRINLFHFLLTDCIASVAVVEDGLFGAVLFYPGAVLKIFSTSHTVCSDEKAFADGIVKTVFHNF